MNEDELADGGSEQSPGRHRSEANPRLDRLVRAGITFAALGYGGLLIISVFAGPVGMLAAAGFGLFYVPYGFVVGAGTAVFAELMRHPTSSRLATLYHYAVCGGLGLVLFTLWHAHRGEEAFGWEGSLSEWLGNPLPELLVGAFAGFIAGIRNHPPGDRGRLPHTPPWR